MTSQYIRIVAIPPGEAPLWVREKWVGLRLPLADSRGPRDTYVSGVLSGPRNRFVALAWRFLGKLGRQTGYAVYFRDAVSELEKTAPDAAAWWRDNVPRLQAPGRKLLFRTPYCELLPAGYTADNQPPFMAASGDAAPLRVGPSPVPQIAKPRTIARISLHRSPLVPALMLALIAFGGIWNWSHPFHPERQVQVHGALVDWSLHNSGSRGGSHQTVHLRITGYDEEFRIDPAIFRDLMGNRLPAGFAKGAGIDITVDAAQIAAPFHPPLEPGVAVVWVHGLVVSGVTVFVLRDVIQHDGGQWTGWFVLVAIVTGYLGFTIINWRRVAPVRST